MNPKILLAFAAGALLASGIVYMAVKPQTEVAQAKAAMAAPRPEPVSPPAPVPPPPEVSPAWAPVNPPRTAKPAPSYTAPRREIAQAAKPPLPPPPTPREPVNKERPFNDAPLEPPAPAASPTPPPAPEPPREQPREPLREPARPTEPLPPPPAHSVTIGSGTTLAVRMGETITSQHNQSGDTFLVTLSQPLVVEGFVIAERGARAEGRIVEADRAGKVKGLSRLTVELTKFSSADGQSVRIHTGPFVKMGEPSTGTDAAKIGGGAALGAIIGAIAGGGKGAGIGAGVGGAAGAGDVLLTRGKDAVIPVETKLTFTIREPVTVTERLR